MISETGQSITTAEQLFAKTDDGNRYELIRGVLTMMSRAGSEHGDIAGRILRRLGDFVERNELGNTFAAETGFRIATSPDTVRAPDVAFVSNRQLATAQPTRGYLALAPDLIVEVVSPNDLFSKVEGKAFEWLRAGTQIVLVADPANLTLQVYRTEAEIQVLRKGDTFCAGDVCSDWKLSVVDAFQIND